MQQEKRQDVARDDRTRLGIPWGMRDRNTDPDVQSAQMRCSNRELARFVDDWLAGADSPV